MNTRLWILILVVAATAALGLVVGAVEVGFDDIIAGLGALFGGGDGSIAAGVVADIRVPRVLGGLAAGAALGIGGTVLQSVYRNMVAEPYLLGMSSAAGLGFVVGALLVPGDISPVVRLTLAAVGAVTVALGIRSRTDRLPYGNGLLLTGVALGFAFLAWTLVVTFTAESPRLPTFTYFVFGSLATATWAPVLIALPLVAVGWVVIGRRARQFDLLAFGDDEASSLGVDVAEISRTSLIVIGVLVAASVVVAGVVGFVGLLAPLLARRLVGNLHRSLIPASALVGALVVLWADIAIRAAPMQVEVPLGVLTAAVGGPILVGLIGRGGEW